MAITRDEVLGERFLVKLVLAGVFLKRYEMTKISSAPIVEEPVFKVNLLCVFLQIKNCLYGIHLTYKTENINILWVWCSKNSFPDSFFYRQALDQGYYIVVICRDAPAMAKVVL